MLPYAKHLIQEGYSISATAGTSKYFGENGIATLSLRKVHEGRPHCVDRIRSGNIAFVVNTTRGKNAIEASFDIRKACTNLGVPCLTESDTAEAFMLALEASRAGKFEVTPLRPSIKI